MKLILATHNDHKLNEARAILTTAIPGFKPESLVSAAGLGLAEPVEDAITFEGNALIKARAVAIATGVAALADDSGLTVDVMGGMPGIFSARWSGAHGNDAANLDLLLAQLVDVPDEHRGAAFVAAVALVLPDGREFTRTGELRGTLRRERAGNGGFGYDPIFQADGMSVTNAELRPEEKNRISHRGLAMRAISEVIQAEL